ncbi:unnamed protein product [Penicillium olsonii]|nr:unnamed protein product [Penicillium olsonii]CAG7921388.1 unnamed protein product [Penicillium olsonii]
MSTFDGIVEVDYFRKCPERPAPLACFLSHVHSDHLQGLESFRAPFIYCSPATRERPIPLNTPTEIELTPRCHIRVTLLDANHCSGAVMFLIEGGGKAVIYTGDIRAEKWWVDSLIRHPVLIPYTLGQKRLDKLYLDTTFASKTNPFRQFPSKAEGLAELLQKVQAYPEDTKFYFRAWTFGYEEVWVALSSALNSKIHVDRYQMGLYQSLVQSKSPGVSEAPALCGFDLGNRAMSGCLSNDESSRIHSCEPGASCSAAGGKNVIYITPIVNRTSNGIEVPEVGLGGGSGDLSQSHELELPDESALSELEKLCRQHVHDPEALSQMRNALFRAFQSKKKALSLDSYGLKQDSEISLKNLVTALSHGPSVVSGTASGSHLPYTIRFPYSRHSSYSELCGLVAAFRPKDLYPCTVDSAKWNENVSMERLFGHLCSDRRFSHDTHMRQIKEDEIRDSRPTKRARYDTDPSNESSQETSSGLDYIESNPAAPSHQPEEQHLPSQLGQLEQAARDKRNEIRRAHRYLHEHAEPGLFQIEPLPTTWPTEAEDNANVQVINESDEDDQATPVPEKASTPLATPSPSESNMRTPTKLMHSVDGAMSPYPFNPQEDSQQTDTLTVSISESAFDSPDQMDSSLSRETVARARRARLDAYLAARQDTFSAWTDVSLVSAENHAEEEIEL